MIAFATFAGLLALSLGLSSPSKAKDASRSSTGLKLSLIGGFSMPLGVVQPSGDRSRLFIVQQRGQIVLLLNGRRQSQPFLDISAKVSCCGEQGLLGLAFAPDYATSGLLYVDYTDRNGNAKIVEYRRSTTNPNLANAATARLVISQTEPKSNHNGGHIVFGPRDRMLYIGLGDGGSGNDPHGLLGNGQNLSTLLGKILRIDPRRTGSRPYTVPSSNPFVGLAGARSEIWAYGLRNPWRFSFDSATSGLVIGDVGQDAIEEIDWAPSPGYGRGVNYGWRPWEGTRANYPGETAASAVMPVAQFTHASGRCSVTGGYVVHDRRIPSLEGKYIYGDFCTGTLWTATLRTGRLAATVSAPLGIKLAGLSTFGEDNAGRIYLASLFNNNVYRLDPR